MQNWEWSVNKQPPSTQAHVLSGLPWAKHQGNWKLGNLRASHTQRGPPPAVSSWLCFPPLRWLLLRAHLLPHSSRNASTCIKSLWVYCQTGAGSKDLGLNWILVFPGRTNEEAKLTAMICRVKWGMGTGGHMEQPIPSLVEGRWARGLLSEVTHVLALGSQMQSSE